MVCWLGGRMGMGCPAKRAGVRSADEKMTSAFWEQPSRMLYRRITTALITRQVGCNLQQGWARRSGPDPANDGVKPVAGFMAAGVVGVLGQWAGRRCDESFDVCLQTISRVFSAPAIAFVTSARAQVAPPPVR